MKLPVPTNLAAFAALVVGCVVAPMGALAQSLAGVSVSLDATTDHRERGLGWSAGKTAASLAVAIPATDRLTVNVEGSTLRDSVRHGGADVGITITPQFSVIRSAINVDVGARANAFVGRNGAGNARLNYIELTSDLDYTLGPVRLGLGAAYAPSQAAIGGDNLYFSGNLEGGIPGSPLTLYGGLGYTSGGEGRMRSARLRPGGDYSDHHVGVEYRQALLAVGLRYSDTSISRKDMDFTNPYVDRHYGSRIAAYIRITP